MGTGYAFPRQRESCVRTVVTSTERKVFLGSKDLYGAISVKAALGSFHLLVRHAGDHLLVPTGFDGPPGAGTVKGGRRPSRSDLPLTVPSRVAGLLGWEAGFSPGPHGRGGSFPTTQCSQT
jgi:hypothetical protein